MQKATINAFILFDPGSTHNFISLELATKLGVQDFEMGDAMKADGAFINQEVSVTPLIGKLRLHIQGYVDKEDFFISPLKHEDVILGAPWFDRLATSIKFPERKISFKFREKDMYINAQESGSSIPLVNHQAFDKSIKSSISVYMIFVKDSLNGVDVTQVNENGMQVDLELSNFLNQFQDVFIDDIPGELPPKRGDDDHMIELIPGSSPPNKPPYRVSQAQQEEIMRQVNKLVEKGMVRPSSSPFCSPVLLVQKKDGAYHMCVDYRALNRITIKNRFPVPRVEDLFDKLQGSTYFSRIDLKSGYHQIRIVDEDIVKTAFCTSFGLYEYLVMPFGLTNAPATFNRMMERIFRPHRNFTGVFFDDVIIYSKTIEEHKEHLKNGIRMDPAKLEVIKDWPNPRNLPEVRSFIDYKPLNAATKRDHFPHPFQDEILNEVARHECYTISDGYSGYYQIRIAEEDQHKTTFITPWGCFDFHFQKQTLRQEDVDVTGVLMSKEDVGFVSQYEAALLEEVEQLKKVRYVLMRFQKYVVVELQKNTMEKVQEIIGQDEDISKKVRPLNALVGK
ncbi:hypothetical protein L7F22_067755 [Adiantum nelumboides]|nr:hypothetical protein [Adiantum nelumboides]